MAIDHARLNKRLSQVDDLLDEIKRVMRSSQPLPDRSSFALETLEQIEEILDELLCEDV